jgi:uncharacterized protein
MLIDIDSIPVLSRDKAIARRPDAPITTDVFVIPHNQTYIVYAPLRRLAFITNTAGVNTIAALREAPIVDLTTEQKEFINFLDYLGLLGSAGDLPVHGLNQDTYQPNQVTLFLTAECNLRCVYCYAQAGDLPPERMSMKTAEQGIDYVVANALELNMDWFGVYYHGGGEPTINHSVLTGSYAYAQKQAEKYHLNLYSSIATNAVLSPRGRRWIMENLQGASVSLDGSPEVNDRNRPNVAGKGSGEQVLETLRAFDEANFPYGIRVTVSAQTIHDMPDTVRFILEHHKPVRMQMEPVYDIGRGKNANLHIDVDAFIQGYRESWKIAHDHGVELNFSSARIDTISSRFCSAYGEGFTLTTKGKVTGCYEVHDDVADFAEDVIFGYFDEQTGRYSFDDDKLQTLRDHNVNRQPWCNGCFAKWHCSGECPNKMRHASMGGEFLGMPSCDITRSIVLDQIVRKIEEAGGVIWQGAQASRQLPADLYG